MSLHRWWSRQFESAEQQETWNQITRCIRRCSIPWQDQEDIADEAFLLYETFRTAAAGRHPLYKNDCCCKFITKLIIRHRLKPKNYLIAACVKRAIRVVRSSMLQQDDDQSSLNSVPDRQRPDSLDQIIRSDQRRRVRYALSSLPRLQRVVVGRHHWGHQRTLSEIGASMHLDRRRVSEVYRTGLRNLKFALADVDAP